ncbi:MAG TPA: hypothetical protein VD835_16350, partial [Pyrinomonadaceae bacterium]|nr:hypothetical protein [Pyrinomonadaceae bacterium]
MKNYTRTRPSMLRAAAVVAVVCAVLLGGSSLTGASAQRRMNPRRGSVQQASVDRGTIARAQSYTGDRFNFFTTTPRGARVASVNRPRAEALHAIDQGLADLFVAARRAGYRARVNYTDYVVFIARADRQRDSTGA